MATKKVDVNADVTAAASYIKEKTTKKDKENTKRVQLIVKADEWEKFQELAHLAGSNCNRMMNNFVSYAVQQYASQITRYEKQRDLMRQELDSMGDKKNE